MNVYLVTRGPNHLGILFSLDQDRRMAQLDPTGQTTVELVPLLPTHRHYKGGEYSFVSHGRHTERDESLTAYFSADGQLWHRPTAMWESLILEQVPVGGQSVTFGRPRFTPLW